MTSETWRDGVVVVTDPERDRYASSRLIPWWDQEKLEAARVIVVGAGALGNEVLKNLALLGAGRVLIVDLDRVERSNLGRSVLFRQGDEGRSKAHVAAERVRAMNPDVRADALDANIVSDVGLGVFRRADLVLGCLDNREARWAVNRACWRMGVPWVDGALNVLDGTVKVFAPPAGACYECGLTEMDRHLMTLRYSCFGDTGTWQAGRIPTTITAASIIAGVQVQEALKLLHGLDVAPGSALIYDGGGMSAMHVTLAPSDGCLAHRTWQPIVELPGASRSMTLGALLAEAQQRLGPEAWLSLDREIVVSWTCVECGRVERVMKPAVRPLAPPNCAACGGASFPEITHTIGDRTPDLDTPLAALGIPALHVIEARTTTVAAYLELTGDAETIDFLRPMGERHVHG